MNTREQASKLEEAVSSEEKERRDKLVDELRRILREASEKDVLGTNEKIVEESNRLTEEYGGDTLNKSRLYHLLINSSAPETAFLDLDGKIEAFIRGFGE